LNRAHRVAFGSRVKRLEQVPGRIDTGITSEKKDFVVFGGLVWTIENRNTTLDRARRVVVGATIGALEQVPGRIWGGFTRI